MECGFETVSEQHDSSVKHHSWNHTVALHLLQAVVIDKGLISYCSAQQATKLPPCEAM